MITIKKDVLKIQYLKGKKSLIGQHAKKKYQWIEDRFQKTMQIEAQTVKKKWKPIKVWDLYISQYQMQMNMCKNVF